MVAAHTFGLSFWEAEENESLWVQDQLGLQESSQTTRAI